MMPTGIYSRPPRRTYEEQLVVTQKRIRHWRVKYPERALHQQARKRALARGKKFSIKVEDIVIPKKCPVLGIVLKRGSRYLKNNAPTIDEIVPGKGYVPGNICIISWRANRLKSDATLIELRKILTYYEAKVCR